MPGTSRSDARIIKKNTNKKCNNLFLSNRVANISFVFMIRNNCRNTDDHCSMSIDFPNV